MASIRIGVDIGGTHTDCVLFDPATNQIRLAKVPTRPAELESGVLEGLGELFDEYTYDRDDVDFFSHGTTITTNALLEREGSQTGMLINEGFRAVQETREQARGYGSATYDLAFEKPEALVSQQDTFEIPGRLSSNGEELEALNEDAVRTAARRLRQAGIETVAICYLFSYANPVHERRTAELIAEEHPDCKVSLSSSVFPQIREWYRMSTTQMNAYLQPVLTAYVARLESALEDAAVAPDRTFIMKSNGGVMPFDAVETGGNTAQTLLSGPAAGVQAGTQMATIAGYDDVVTIDMGGTSADMALVTDGDPVETTQGTIGGLDMHLPMLDVEPISAGGGTIAWLDEAGELRVGPKSAGADPGPACYPKGGSEPTVTDADVALGRLNPEYYLGGDLHLDSGAASEALDTVGESLGLNTRETALGIARLIDTTMAQGIRSVAAQRGQDLREFTLVAFGGAAPVHAVAIAEELSIPRILVPPSPGVSSALGLLTVDVTHDYSRSKLSRISETPPEQVDTVFTELEEQAAGELDDEGFEVEDAQYQREFDLRYAGQGHEIRIPVPSGRYTESTLSEMRLAFDEQHRELRGHAAPEDPVEIVTYRVRARVEVPKYEPERAATDNSRMLDPREYRTVVWDRDRVEEIAIYRRQSLVPSDEIQGPAVIEQPDSTTVVRPGWSVRVDEYGNLLLERTSESTHEENQ